MTDEDHGEIAGEGLPIATAACGSPARLFVGALEYLINFWGLSALYLLAFALYVGSALAAPRGARTVRW